MRSPLDTLFRRGKISPRALAGFFTEETWLVHGPSFEPVVDLVTQGAIAMSAEDIEAARAMSPDPEPVGYSKAGGTARIPIQGMIMRRVPLLFRYFGVAATSTEEVGKAFATAVADPDVERVEFTIDSPGGTLAGTVELADLIYSESTNVATYAHVDGMAASAAYWIAAQTEAISATRGSVIGSIGVYQVIVDASVAMATEGYQVHVVSSHELKGAGVWGSEITDNQIADFQRTIDDAAAMFVEAVDRGRPSLNASQLATGQVWFAEEAQSLGLVDSVESVPQTPSKSSSSTTEEASMTPEEIAALRAELDDAKAKAASADARATQAEARAAAETAIRAASEITAIIDDGLRAGRIPPAARPQLEAFAATATPKALRAFVASFPALTRPNAQGGSPTQDVAPQMSEEAQAAFHKMCRNPAARDIAETARGSFQITGDGEIVTGSKSFALKALQGDK